MYPKKMIFIQLLDEGTKAYRPVLSTELSDNTFKVGITEFYDPDDEIWEFLPGFIVLVQEKVFENRIELVAIKELSI
jgi:hypothetical protein